jgi:hypothetical protein
MSRQEIMKLWIGAYLGVRRSISDVMLAPGYGLIIMYVQKLWAGTAYGFDICIARSVNWVTYHWAVMICETH